MCAALALVLVACQSAVPAPTPTADPTLTSTVLLVPPTPSRVPSPSAAASPVADQRSTPAPGQATAAQSTQQAFFGLGRQGPAATEAATPAVGTQAATPSGTAVNNYATFQAAIFGTNTPAARGTATAAPTAPAQATVSQATVQAIFGGIGTPAGGTPTPKPSSAAPLPAPPKPGGTATSTPAPARQTTGAPTLAQLHRALLTEDDLGEEWLGFDSDDDDQDYAAAGVEFAGDDGETLSIELHDARNGAPDFLALSLLGNQKFDQFTQTTPPEYGTGGARYRYQRTEDGTRLYGEVVGWRHGAVIATMMFESEKPDACVCDFGRKQEQKLTATFR
jgi:hypothetical protein